MSHFGSFCVSLCLLLGNFGSFSLIWVSLGCLLDCFGCFWVYWARFVSGFMSFFIVLLFWHVLGGFGLFCVFVSKFRTFSGNLNMFWVVLVCFHALYVSLSLLLGPLYSRSFVVRQYRFHFASFCISLCLLLGRFGLFWVSLGLVLNIFSLFCCYLNQSVTPAWFL